MANEPIPSAQQLESARERVIDTLSEHFAHDNISMEELERRLEQVYAASTPAAISAVLGGLPVLAREQGLTPMDPTPLPAAPPGRARTLFALMSGIVRRGAWVVPRELRLVAVMGGVEIDLRDARLGAVTEIQAFALMGGIVVTVPPDVRVESDGVAFMGGFEDQLDRRATLDPKARLVRLTGLAIMGGVEVKVMASGQDEAGPRRD